MPSEATFAPVFEQTRRLVFTICRRLLRNEEDAFDAFQGTYCRLLEAVRAGRTREPDLDPAGYVGRLAYREADRLKKKTTRRARKEEVMASLPETPDSTPGPDEIAASHELRRRVEALVDTLPEELRVPILLHYFHALSQTEIAKIEGVPVSTVSRRITRGMEKLRPRMLRAGLGEVTTTLGACLAAARLLDPGEAAAAASVFNVASQSLTSAGTGGAASASVGGGAGAAGGAATWWASLLSAKAVVVAAVVVLGAAGGIVAVNKMSSSPPPLPSSPPTVPAASSPSSSPDGGSNSSKPGTPSVSPAGTVVTASNAAGPAPQVPEKETTDDKSVAKTSPSESETSEKKLRSEARIAVSGKVLLPDGSPAIDAAVTLYSITVKYPVEMVKSVEAQTMTDKAGQFALEGNDDLIVCLIARKDGFAEASSLLLNQEGANTGLPLPPGVRTATQDLVLAAPAMLRGVVKDEKGNPVAGAQVRARRVDKDNFSTVVPPVETSSNAKGEFVVSQLRRGPVQLHVSSEGYAATMVVTETPNDSFEVRLSSEGATVEGRVYRKPSGEAVADAEISFLWFEPSKQGFPIAPPASTSTDDTGAYRFDHLSPGYYLPTVRKDDLYQLFSKNPLEDLVHVQGNETKTGSDLFLFSGYTLTGTVTDRDTGAPIEGVDVAPPLTILDMKPAAAVTDAEGKYRLENLSGLGDRRLVLEKEGYEKITNGDVDFDPGKLESTKDFQMTAEKTRDVVLSGIVKTPEGAPVSGAAVSLYGAKEERTTTDEGGKFEVQTSAFHPALLRVEARGYPVTASQVIDVLDKPVTAIEIILPRPATLRGTVVDPQGHPVPDAVVSATQLPSAGAVAYWEELGKQTTLADGTFQIANLPQGSIELSVDAVGFPTLQRVKVQLNEGEVKTGVKLVLPASHFLAGRVLDPEGNPLPMVQMNIYSGGNSGISGLTDNHGTFRLTDLPETATTLYITHDKYGSKSFEHIELDRENAEFAFDTAEQTALIGRVIDAKTKEPVDPFTVLEYGSSPPQHFERTGPGVFRVGHIKYPNNYQYRIEAPGYVGLDVQLQSPPNVREFAKTFELGRGGRITGRAVRQEAGDPAVNISVLLLNLETFSYRDRQTPLQSKRTGPDGRFAFDKVPSGRLGIRIVDEQTSTEAWKEISLSMDEELDLGDVTVGGSGMVRGQLVRLSGWVSPSGHTVNLRETRTLRTRTLTTGADGTFEFAGLPSMEYLLFIPSLGISKTADLTNTDHLEFRFEFGTATLRGRVLKGTTPIQAEISVSAKDPDPFAVRVESGSDGTFAIANLPAGPLRVSVSPVRQCGVDRTETITFAPNAVLERDFVIPGGRLTGRVLGPDGRTPEAGVNVEATRNGEPNDPAFTLRTVYVTFADGAFDLTLPEGFYTVTAKTGSKTLVSRESVYVPEEGSSEPVELVLPAAAP